MKIVPKLGSWQFLAHRALKLWPEERTKSTAVSVTPLYEKRQFKAWPPVNGYRALAPLASNTVDLKALERFVDVCPKTLSYEGFIASHLQHEAMDVKAMHDHQRNVSVEKMKMLIVETIKEMKSIELNQFSHNKG